MALGLEDVRNPAYPQLKINFMDPAEASNGEECYGDRDKQSEALKTSAQVTSGAENVTTDRRLHEMETSKLEHEETRKEIEQIPSKRNNEGSETTLIASSQAEGVQFPPEDLSEIGSLDEKQRQAQELLALSSSAFERFQLTEDIEDLDKSIEYLRGALALTPSSDEGRLGLLNSLGCVCELRFERLDEISDLENVIKIRAEAVSLAPDDHPEKPGYLANLGVSYSMRFESLGDLSDLHKAIKTQTEAVSLTHDGHPERAGPLNNLGLSYLTRFEHLDELSDLNKAVEYQEEVVLLTPDGHPDKPMYLSNLGISYNTRFERLDDLSDLNRAIKTKSQAASLTPDGHPHQMVTLNNLGASYLTRFERLGELSDLQEAIEAQTKAVSLAPDGDPSKPGYLTNLGLSFRARFERLGELSDLNAAIDYQAQAISLASGAHAIYPDHLNNLGASYITRFMRLSDLSDLNAAIKTQSEAVSLMPDGHPGKPAILSNLGVSYKTRFERLGELPDLNKAIQIQTEVVSLTPHGHPGMPGYLSNLGDSYLARSERLGELSDLNKSIESLAEAVFLAPDGHPQKAGYLISLGLSYRTRYDHLGELPDLHQAIQTQTEGVLLTPDGHTSKPGYLNNLGVSYRARFMRLGEISDSHKAIKCISEAVSLTPNGHSDKLGHLNNLGASYITRYKRLSELSDLNAAIETQSEAVSLTPDGHPRKPAILSNLGVSYRIRFERLDELSDLTNAIETQSNAISLTPDGHPHQTGCLSNLGISYATRFVRTGNFSDLTSAESLFRRASQSPTGPPSLRFLACQKWANIAALNSTSSPDPFPAYQQAMSLIPQLVWIGTTIDRRYELIAEVSSFATEAASYAISVGLLDLALEWLEAGRSIVWGQISQLRTPFEELSAHSSELAEELTSVARQLEHAGSRSYLLSFPSTNDPNLGQEANTHVQLALRWDKLLEEIRLMPGLEDFLRSPTAGQLLGAAEAHPVAIINLHKSRCDALIIQPGIDIVSHVALPEFSFEDALSARRHVFSQVRNRRPGHLSTTQNPLRTSQESLWSGVIKPVLDFLGCIDKLPVEQLPHITWCTTGLLSFIPLHTARSHDESQPGAFDLVVSSYTPTLGALLSSRSADPSPGYGILAVGQENTPGLANLPCTTKELAVIHKHTGGDHYLQLEGDEATIKQVLDAMDRFSWVHMACHGSQDPYDPTKSAFHLHDGNLTLADITKRSFTNKGLAFLSACQTATGDENMPDEAVHLAAGMLMAGYPSVIGTMWSIADEDGPEVADLVYAELLKDGKMDHTNAARALHRAVSQLRGKVGEEHIERWAPFIHIGV